MKNILLLAHDDAGQESRFQAALDLTRAVNGHLTCLGVSIVPLMLSDVYAVTVEAAVFADELEREAKNRERLEARLAREDVSWQWIDVTGNPAQQLEAHGGLADIIVVSRKLETEPMPDTRAIASEVVVGSGKLVLAVPEFPLGFDVTGHAMVAWDGSDEAMKALQAATPLLELARMVTIVTIEDGSAGKADVEAAAYLSRHGVSAVVARRPGTARPTADLLIAEAKAEGADYVVMGAFGRSRIVEAILGGVSREMLGESPIPIVMAH